MYTSCTFSPLANLVVHDVHEGLLSTVGYGSQARSAHEQFAPWVLLPVPLHATISVNCKVDLQKNSLIIDKSVKRVIADLFVVPHSDHNGVKDTATECLQL